ncbi:MAG: 2-phospho-L-lactate transferase, partial [Chloroflexi bacterium]|nr:2-phospho-L-lactate transferase [Chloroflexota bacterium]
QLLLPENLTIIVNTGDDFEHLGLYISPDLDTVCYTLAGLANSETGWGRLEETFHVLESLQKLGGPDWFRLGDRDLATHIERTRRMQEGQPLSLITRAFCRAWGIDYSILPMSDQPVFTMVETTEDGELAFQEYFVHRKCEPKVKGFRFDGIENARPAPGVLEAIEQADAVVICPSNPWVSIDPILAMAGLRSAIAAKYVVAVSPIIGRQTIKGPAAKMYIELGVQPSALAVARHYGKLLSGFLLDKVDANLVQNISIPTLATNILMKNQDVRRRLAQDVLNLINTL